MWVIFWHDLKLALRSGSGVAHALGFFGIVLLVTPLGIKANGIGSLETLAPALIWISALLALLLSLERIWQLDFEDGSLDLITLAPVALESVVLAKTAVHWVLIGMPVTILGSLTVFLISPNQTAPLWMGIALGIGTPSLCLIGCFGAALTVGIRRGSLLLSLILLPACLPVLIFGTTLARQGALGFGITQPLMFLLGFGLFSVGTLPFVTAHIIKTNLQNT